MLVLDLLLAGAGIAMIASYFASGASGRSAAAARAPDPPPAAAMEVHPLPVAPARAPARSAPRDAGAARHSGGHHFPVR